MKKQSILCIIALGIVSAYAVSQELIKPKTKKTYVSEQQCIELDGDLVVCGTQASGVLIELSKAIFLVTQSAVTRVNDYACGEKECLNKMERTELYIKKTKIKEKIAACIQDIERMVQSLNVLIAAAEE
jgi:hypothetical protein